MNSMKKTGMLFLFAVTMATSQFWGAEVRAQSSYYTSMGCVDCHTTTATCNGCHAHGTHSSSAKSDVNIKGTTSKTAYAPGETVSVTIAGGYRTGWARAVLLDQNQVEVARSAGPDSGMGSSTTYPAVLTAPAPAAPGTYTWKVAWYGNEYDKAGASFGTQWIPDPFNPNHGMQVVSTNSFTVGSPADTTAPVVASFTLPATATSLTVAVSAFAATDNVAVTGYQITTSATAPAATAAGWSAAATTSVTAAAAGSATFYGWAKDAAGNVSLAKSATVVITLPDTTAPVVGAFTLPAAATSLTVPVTAFAATDDVAVTGYLVTTSATAPAASAAGWTAAAPASVTAAAAGSATFYGWAKDAAGNVSVAKSATVVITLPDTTAPVVGTFTLPATATSLTVPVSALAATDNVAVTGYQITTSATAPAATAAGWTAATPASITAAAPGSATFYAWAKDGAGNVSAAKSATVVIVLPDTAAPVVTTFTLPATATNLTVPVTALVATDDVAVTGYQITTSATAPAASAIGWTAAAPASVTAAAPGSATFYAWAKDAAGNVSLAKSATVVINLPDTTAPVVNTFTLPATATGTAVPVTALAATDNVAVTGYLISTSATAPAASATGWTVAAPAGVTAAASGSTTFYAWAKDAAGNVSIAKSATVTVATVDTTKPVLSVSALADGAYTNKVTLNISGTATDAGGLDSVTVNGQVVAVSVDGSFSTALNLIPGANAVAVSAKDKAGNQQTDTRTVTYDPAAPILTIASPADNSTAAQSLVTLTGTMNESSSVSVTVNNGSPQSAIINGSTFTAAVYLAAGVNTINITATDLAGNVTSAKRTVTYASTQQLSLAVTYPVQDITTKNSILTLKGTVDDALGSKVTVKITMNGRTYTPSISNGAFQQRLVFTTAKLYAITITAKDDAGNTSTVVRNVIYRPSKKARSDDHDDD